MERAKKLGIEVGKRCILDGCKSQEYEVMNIFWGCYDNDDDTLIVLLSTKGLQMGWNALSDRLTLIDDIDQLPGQMNIMDFIGG